MSVVRSPVRSVVRSPVRSVLGSGALSDLQQLIALDPSLLIWPAKGSGWQGTSGGTLSATGEPVGLLTDLAALEGKTQAEWLAAPTTSDLYSSANVSDISVGTGTIVTDGNQITLTTVDTSNYAFASVAFTAVANKAYLIDITVAKISGEVSLLYMSDTNLTNINGNYSPGNHQIIVRADTTAPTIRVQTGGNTEGVFTFTINYVRELPGNHLRAGTWASPADSSRALLATDGEGRLYLDHDGVNDQYSLLNSTGVTDGTLCIVDNSGVYFQDFRDSGDYRAPDINLEALAIYPTVLTAGERATVASAFGRSSHTYANVLLALNKQTASNLRLDTSDASAWAIDWGDGTTATPASAATATRTYAAAYTGLVRATATANITRLDQTVGRVAAGAGQVPATVTSLNVFGTNTLTGNVSALPTGLTILNVQGSNTLTGNVSGLPTGLTYLSVTASNTLSGNVSGLPTGLTYLNVTGTNTLTGNVSGLPTGLAHLGVIGTNTLSGNVSDLPTGLTFLNVTGTNTLSGNVSGLPTGVTYLNVQGSNTLSGNVSDLPTGLTFMNMRGSNTLSVTSATSWRTASMQYVLTYSALTSAEVDDLLIAMATVTSWTNQKQIQLNGGSNAARTAASDSAVSTIEGYGVTVVTAP